MITRGYGQYSGLIPVRGYGATEAAPPPPNIPSITIWNVPIFKTSSDISETKITHSIESQDTTKSTQVKDQTKNIEKKKESKNIRGKI